MTEKNPKDAPVDFDELLQSAEDVSGNGDSDEKTPEQLRIEALEAELAKPLPVVSDESVFEDVEKTPEQLRIEELEAKLAIRNAAILDATPDRFEEPQGDTLLFHVVEDGFTAFSRVWYRGQEIRLTKKDLEETKDRHGNSWVNRLLNDQNAQYAKWGRVYIAPGPFVPRPGEVFDDELTKEDLRRRGAVPVFGR